MVKIQESSKYIRKSMKIKKNEADKNTEVIMTNNKGNEEITDNSKIRKNLH